MNPRPFSCRGFSLIELLVTITIVAVLTGMLLPTLSRAKARAKQVNCLNNARQLALGVLMYVDDHDDTFPPSADYSVAADQPIRIWTAIALPYVQSPQVFSCPSVPNRSFPSNWDQRGLGSIGYTTATAYDPANIEGFATPTRSGIIDEASRTPIFADTPNGPTAQKYRGFTFSPYNGLANSLDPRWGTPLVSDRDLVRELDSLPPADLKPVIARHSGQAILIFADGHAQAYSVESILAQDRGAALHWRFRPQVSGSP